MTQFPEERNGSTVRWKVSAIVDVSTKWFFIRDCGKRTAAKRLQVCGGKTCLGVAVTAEGITAPLPVESGGKTLKRVAVENPLSRGGHTHTHTQYAEDTRQK